MNPTPTTTPETAAPQLPKNPYVKIMGLSLLTLLITYLLAAYASLNDVLENKWTNTIFNSVAGLAFFSFPFLIFFSTRFMLKNENPRGKLATEAAAFFFIFLGGLFIYGERSYYGITIHRRQQDLQRLYYAAESYLEDHDTYSAADQWCDALIDMKNTDDSEEFKKYYLTNYLADELKLEQPCHFAMNDALANKHPSDLPDHTVMFFEAAGTMNLHGDEAFFHSQHDLFPQRYLILIDGTVIIYHPAQQEYNFFPLMYPDTPCPTPIWQPE